MTNTFKLMRPQSRTITTFEYRGIVAEIAHPHGELPEETRERYGHQYSYGWCLYLYLRLERFVDQRLAETLWLEPVCTRFTPVSPERWHYDYDRQPWFHDIPLHWGMTYYDRECSPDPSHRVIKIGCDYRHLDDRDESYDVRSLTCDAMTAIDAIYDLLHGGYLRWCSGKGTLHPEDQVIETETGSYSFDYVREQHAKGRWLAIAIPGEEGASHAQVSE